LGECGFRGGYAEFLNFEPDVIKRFQKMKNIYKGANSIGQVLTDLMINPPSAKNNCSEETVA
jgi:alanine transaminase